VPQPISSTRPPAGKAPATAVTTASLTAAVCPPLKSLIPASYDRGRRSRIFMNT